jgi:hypothetical protein
VLARFRPEPAPRLPSGEIDFATIASYVAEDLSAIFGSNIKINIKSEATMEKGEGRTPPTTAVRLTEKQ